jgi:CheY-like chemotaxis protein
MQNPAAAVLVVDDDPTDLFFTRELLARAEPGLVVDVVQRPEEAIPYLERRLATGSLPRMVLLDIKMPRMDGFDVLKAVKEDPRFKDVRVVMHSMSDEPIDQTRSKALGGDEYLMKYATPAEVRRVLNAHSVGS